MEIVKNALSSDAQVRHVESRNEVKVAYCSHDKFKKVFGDSTETKLEDGIAIMAKWVQARGPMQSSSFSDIEIEENLPPFVVGKIRSVSLFLRRNLLRILSNLLKSFGIDSKRFGPPSGYYWSLEEFYQSGIDSSKVIFKNQIDALTIGRPYNFEYLQGRTETKNTLSRVQNFG